MPHEITDTTNKYMSSDLPDGRTSFRVVSVEKKFGKNGGEYFKWTLQHPAGEGQQILLPNMMGPLLRALKCTEPEPNKFDWVTEDQTGKPFIATVSHKADAKTGVMRQNMGEFAQSDETDIPF